MLFNASPVTVKGMVRRFGTQVAMSLAVSTAAAGLMAVPGLLFGGSLPATEMRSAVAGPSAVVSLVAADGKIRDRHRNAADDDVIPPRAGTLVPAALAMPMSTGWPEPGFPETTRIAVTEKPARLAVAEVLPPRRPVIAVDRVRLAAAAPLPLMPQPVETAMAAPDRDAPRLPAGILGRIVNEPVARATGLVSSATGIVGAAGSWTVSQATSLLPRW